MLPLGFTLPSKRSARHAAWELLRQVWQQGAYANLVWSRILVESSLSQDDRRFATELAYGTLRHHGQLEAIVHRAGGKSATDIEPEVWWVILLGTYQLTHMRTASHAAVHETVALTSVVRKSRAKGLVNAILRRVSHKSLDEWLDDLCEEVSDPDIELGLRFAHPTWIVRKLREALAREGAEGELTSLLASHNQPAKVTLALLPGLSKAEAGETATPLSPLGVYFDGDPGDDLRVREGRARVQDEGSQLAALIACGVSPFREGERALDACSGPGGKAAVLASFAVPAQASLTALDVAPHRAHLVEVALGGFGETNLLQVIPADAVEYLNAEEEGFDRILLDAPCSGVGALRRRPEARWVKSVSDLEPLGRLQRRLLEASLERLIPGGHLIYVTCSPVVEETSEVIEEVTSSRPDIVAVDTGAVLRQVARIDVPRASVGTAVQLWPHRHGTDAMFIQVLKKMPR